MPLLKEENPKISESLSAMALRLRQDEQALQKLSQTDDRLRIDELRQCEPAVRSRKIENFLKCSGVKEPESEHIALAEALVFSDKPSAKAHLPGNIMLCRQYDVLTVADNAADLPETRLNCPGTTVVGEYCFQCEKAVKPVNSKYSFTLPQGNWVIRSRRSGDEIHLSGGTKSLKKLFIDRKIPAQKRCQIPVIADEAGVAAIYGIGTDQDRFREEPAWLVTVTVQPFDKENKTIHES